MQIQPILTEEDHSKALAEIEALWGSARGTPEGDKLDVLITLVDRYEDEHYPIGPADPIDVIKLHMEMTGRSQTDLATLLGSASRASELLNKRRSITLDMVHRLHKEWSIPAEYLIVPYELERLPAARANALPKATGPASRPKRKIAARTAKRQAG